MDAQKIGIICHVVGDKNQPMDGNGSNFTIGQGGFTQRHKSCSSTDGYANEWHLVHLVSRAVGGAGLIITEAAAVEPRGRITPQDLGIWSDGHIEFLAKIVELIHNFGSVAGIQLVHAGRKASTAPPWEGGKAVSEDRGGWRPVVAPSAIPFSQDSPVTKALSLEEIQQIVSAFVQATRRSLSAEFKLVEIHAAHGYLLHEFLSPLSNHPDDEYGGSFENRTRLLREVVQAVREVLPDNYPLWVRISATDWAENGWNIEQSIALSDKLKSLGVELIDCSSGALVPGVKVPTGPFVTKLDLLNESGKKQASQLEQLV